MSIPLRVWGHPEERRLLGGGDDEEGEKDYDEDLEPSPRRRPLLLRHPEVDAALAQRTVRARLHSCLACNCCPCCRSRCCLWCRRVLYAFLSILVLTVLIVVIVWTQYPLRTACDTPSSASSSRPFPPRGRNISFAQGELRVNHLQTFSTHNSYHRSSWLLVVPPWLYTHPPLRDQLRDGARGVELDLHHARGHFTIYHEPVVDDRSTVVCLADALAQVRDWALDNPCHVLTLISIEPKDALDYDHWCRHANSGDLFREIQGTILAWLPRDRLLTPMDVQGDAATMRAALRGRGWPTVASTRGMFILELDLWSENVRCGDAYSTIPPAERLFFQRRSVQWESAASRRLGVKTLGVSLTAPTYAARRPGAEVLQGAYADDAAIVGLTNAPSHAETVATLVRAGYFVRSVTALAGTTHGVDNVRVLLHAGAHLLAVDAWEADYVLAERGQAQRCNPQTAPSDCAAALARIAFDDDPACTML